jgi:leader peptidase (prepilin peptidase)/N-methyltransferase
MAMALFEVGATLLGACIGSFLNVVIWRLQQLDPAKRSVGGRSHCPHCGALIRWFDNVPIVSWLLLRAKARCCQKPISSRYPLVEALTAGLFLLLALRQPYGDVLVQTPDGLAVAANAAVAFGLHAAFLSVLVALSFIDFDTRLLPDVLTIPGICLGLVAGGWPGLAGGLFADPTTNPWVNSFVASLAGYLVGGGVTWAIRIVGTALFRKEAMGFGDVKLMAMIGAVLGWQSALLTMFLGCLFGAVGGGLGVLLGRGNVIPFGPFLALGAVVCLFWRDAIVYVLFTAWPEWQSQNPAAQWLVLGTSLVLLLLLFAVVRRARRAG